MKGGEDFSQPFPDFRIIGKIGTGTMGAVFLARQLSLDRLVALKVLKPSFSKNRSYVERLRREARLAARLDHPNIVTAYDLRHEKGYHFFVMEYVEGRSLRELLKDWGRLPEDRVVQIGIDIAGALEHARQHGIIHRDIKPANILVQGDNTVKLADLGLARGPEAVSATKDGMGTMGTPLYMSPEQSRDPRSVDARSDIYSLGATLFHLACGVPPFPGRTLAEVLTKVLHGRPADPSGSFPEISRGLDLVLRKCLVREPEGRYQLPLEMKSDLERVREEGMPRLDPGELERRPASSRLLLWLLLILLPLAAAGGFLALPRGEGTPGEPSPTGDPAVRWYARLEETATTDLAALIQELELHLRDGVREVAPVLARARKRLCDRVFDLTIPREKGLATLLEKLEPGVLPGFPARVDQVLERELTVTFGLAPEDLPDPRAVKIYTSSRNRLIRKWEDQVSRFFQEALDRLEALAERVWEEWGRERLGRDYTRRLSRLQDLFTLEKITVGPDLPAAETAQLRAAVERVRTELEARLRTEAESWVGTHRNRVLRRLDGARDDLADEPGEEELRRLRRSLADLRNDIAKSSPPAGTLPRFWRIDWSPPAYLARIGRLERSIDERLLALEKERLAGLSNLVALHLEERDYGACREVLAGAELVTGYGRRHLARLARRVEQQEEGEEILLGAVKGARDRVVDLSVKGVSQRRRIHRVTGGGVPARFVYLENKARPGRVLKVPYRDLDIGSLLDLVDPGKRRAQAQALLHLLLQGGAKELTLAEGLLPSLPPGERPELARLIAARRKRIQGETPPPEEEAKRLLAKLVRAAEGAIEPARGSELTRLLLGRFATTELVARERERILALQTQASELAGRRGKMARAAALFPGWELICDFPRVEARARLDRVLVGRVFGHRRWAYDEKGPACYSPARSIAGFLEDHWSMETRLRRGRPLRVEVEIALETNFTPPDQILLSLGSLQAGLVSMTRSRVAPPVWRPLLMVESRLNPRTFLGPAWLAWLGRGEEIRLHPGGRYRLAIELGRPGRGGRQVDFRLDGRSLLSAFLEMPGRSESLRLDLRLSGPGRIASLEVAGVPLE